MNKLLAISLAFVVNCAAGQTTLPPGSVGYFLSNAVKQSQDKKYDAALVFVDSALKLNPVNEHTYALKAEILWLKKDFINAARSYQQSILLDRDSSYLKGCYLLLAVLYEKAGRKDMAQQQYLKAVYFFENKKQGNDRLFESVNKIDYAIALRLSGNLAAWDKLMADYFYHAMREIYDGKTREEVLCLYFKQYSGE